MEHLRGLPLDLHLARDEFPTPEARRIEVLQLGFQIASVMAAAHAKGVVHRDLKPRNIVVTFDPFSWRGRRVKIIDFGIAQILVDNLPHTLPPTRIGTGTPGYMAPEQACRTGPLTQKVDVYALGVILYEAITGALPYDQGIAPAERLKQREPSTPDSVAVFVDRMLKSDPTERPVMPEVVVELQKLTQENAEFAQAVWRWETSQRTECTVGDELQRFLGWAKDKNLTFGEEEFLGTCKEADAIARQVAKEETARARARADRNTKAGLAVAGCIFLALTCIASVEWGMASAAVEKERRAAEEAREAKKKAEEATRGAEEATQKEALERQKAVEQAEKAQKAEQDLAGAIARVERTEDLKKSAERQTRNAERAAKEAKSSYEAAEAQNQDWATKYRSLQEAYGKSQNSNEELSKANTNLKDATTKLANALNAASAASKEKETALEKKTEELKACQGRLCKDEESCQMPSPEERCRPGRSCKE